MVELADSLDSGSSVHYGRAGSSPASRTKKKDRHWPVFLFGPWGCEEAAFLRGPRADPTERRILDELATLWDVRMVPADAFTATDVPPLSIREYLGI